MADYFETDTITKEYDGKLVRRILSYLKPYRLPVFLTLAALFISTLGELYLPAWRLCNSWIRGYHRNQFNHGVPRSFDKKIPFSSVKLRVLRGKNS